ncbi:MAG: glycosyltransferase family 39 protein, partial [Clostridia bacterium]|nr:glycosyltransferase family 39 protein [Clostridia bacterium]
GYGATSTGEAWFDDLSVKKIDNTEGYQNVSFYPFTVAQADDNGADGEDSTSSIYVYFIAAFVVIVIASLIIMQTANKKKGKKNSDEKETVTLKGNVPLSKPILSDPTDTRLNFSRKDWIACIALTVVYAVVALFNLGSLSAPQTYYKGEFAEKFTLTFEHDTKLSSIWIYTGIDEGTILITDNNGGSITHKIINGNMFRWKKIDNSATLGGKEFTVEVTAGTAWINEIAFIDTNGDVVTPSASIGAEAVIDEQDTVPDEPTYYNGMYFDELYHARTAYEHIHNMYPYEWTHPPLGKILMSIGIAIFGMSAFGWRIVGTLFGVGMVPIMYCFAKRVFKKWEYAFITAAIFAFDFMHFSQTRIATIDVYGVFFIILMYYYMYQYYSMSFYTHGLKKTLKPLALAGLFFGLGIASKWISFYAGGGLALILVASFIKRYKEGRELIKSKSQKERAIGNSYWSNVMQTVMWCCCFYLIIPFIIYFLSYIPVFKYYGCFDGNGFENIVKCFERFITEQQRMFSYHADLEATHSFSSPWYQWPVIARPVWYYIGYYSGTNNASTISGMGNPAVWWVASLGSLAIIVCKISEKFKSWLNGK